MKNKKGNKKTRYIKPRSSPPELNWTQYFLDSTDKMFNAFCEYCLNYLEKVVVVNEKN